MKNKILSLFTLLLVTAVFTSCDNGDDVDGIVQVNKPTMTIDFPTAVTAAEGTSIPITVNLSAPVGKPFNLYIVMDRPNSTADGSDSDVTDQSVNTTFQKVIEVPAFVTTYSDVIEISEDDLAEGSEILKLNVGDSRTSAVTFTPVVSTVTITNAVSNDLTLTFHFDKTFTGTNGYTNTLCGFVNPTLSPGPPVNQQIVDIDFILYDEGFNDTNNTTAQTGACNETMTISLDDLADGLYHVTSYLYTNGGIDNFPVITTPFSIPITVDYLRAGGINKATFTQDSANWFTSDSAPGEEYQVVDVLISTVNGVRKFSIQTIDLTNPVVVATGKKIGTKAKFVSKRKN